MDVSAGHYLYVRQTDTNGVETTHAYRVWNDTVFLAALSDSLRKENDKARQEGNPAKAACAVISEKTYDDYRFRRS